MTAPLLDVKNLSVQLPTASGGLVPVIHDATLHVNPGEIVGIAGESGSGKSMTAQALLGLLPEGARIGGEARLGERDLLALRGRQWDAVRGREIAMVFQDATSALHPMLTIGTQLTEHMRHHLGLGKKEARARAAELLDKVRIPEPERTLKSYPHQFSGGMRQRVAIAMALACEPRLLIADEPTTALDVTVQAGILELLDELRRDMGLSVLFITHDLGVLAALTARTYVFYAGRVMETAATPEVLLSPRHPYTSALLKARPHAGDQWESGREGQARLVTIPGTPATPASAGPGGPFAPRCTFREDRCEQSPPPLLEVAPGHRAACLVQPELEEIA
jgi:oligopeptide/dipeptide ABC transporter, ATP-binding protein, C-terminal domain